jgi:hypothetical protein
MVIDQLGHLVQSQRTPSLTTISEARGIDEGLADYFNAAYAAQLGRANPSDVPSGVPGVGSRHLNQPAWHVVIYNPCNGVYDDAYGYYGSEVFGGALWDTRLLLQAAGVAPSTIDRWVFDALAQLRDVDPGNCTFLLFRNLLLSTPPLTIAPYDQLIRDAFARHNISETTVDQCTPRPVILSVDRHVEGALQQIYISWSAVPTADFYRVYLHPFNPASSAGLGVGELVADSLRASSWVYSTQDTTMVPAFVVAAVDSGGYEGPPSREMPELTAVPGRITVPASRLSAVPNPTRRFVFLSVLGVPSNVPMLIRAFDVNGRIVRSWKAIGGVAPVKVQWDSRDDSGRDLPAGVYIVYAKAGYKTWTTKVVLIP